ncbi:MAG: MerR family transcriptional regulator [Myxococcota bacterium]
MTESDDRATPSYRIGAVSRLTQIPAETLRVWERRYHVVEPRRGGGQTRLYDREDVERLTLIKQLVDRGHAISTVASLSLEELKERLQEHHVHGMAALTAELNGEAVPTLVIGETLSAMAVEGAEDLDGVDVVGTAFEPGDVDPNFWTRRPRVVVLECSTVDHRTAKLAQNLLRRTGALRLLVVYGFGTKEHIQRLSGGRVRAVRGPINSYELARVVLESEQAPIEGELRSDPIASDLDVEGAIPARRYSNATLARLSRMSSAVECECPQHMVALVTQLVAFEEYSAECEDRNERDAAIHAMLRRVTAHSRAHLEDAMARLLEAEGISL